MFVHCLHVLLTLAGLPDRVAPASLEGPTLTPAMTALMALVAVDAVVDISRNVVVMEIVGVIAAMAAGALENRVVVGVDMARRTHATRVAMARWKLRVLRMVKGRARPCGCVVASLACRGEELRLRSVARVRGVVVVSLVAADTSCRQRRVVVVHVAVSAHAAAAQYANRSGGRPCCCG